MYYDIKFFSRYVDIFLHFKQRSFLRNMNNIIFLNPNHRINNNT